MISTNELRKRFLAFFKSKGHEVIASDMLVPKNDPSVLFTSAGMNQFKEQFLGKVSGFRRAASSQKCLRTGDLEKVGKTPAHHTFFEMLGNFSFGDYFKKEAILWAWEFLTQTLAIDPEKLWVSVYEEDKEAYAIWQNDIRVPQEKIYSFGQKDNFWPSNAIKDGPNGPCGPCSEIFFDWGKEVGCGRSECSPACDCGRFVEIWNLVFTQFDRKESGKLEPLPSKNIDTGMGLERMAACLQGVKTNFEIDIFKPIVGDIRKALDIKAPVPNEKINCIADHVRAAVFAIGDGVLPSNENRGYVIRKLIRRASWFVQESGLHKPFLYTLVSRVCELMKEPYPELCERRDNIAGVIRSEEERFLNNIKEGRSFLEETIVQLKQKSKNTLSGQNIFKLYDTYGFPLELTEIFAKENGLELDLVGFNKEMAKQREKARAASAIAGDIFAKDILEILPSQFVGYDSVSLHAQIIQIIVSKKNVESIAEAEEGWLVLDKTPFYGESGGQVGDTGEMTSLKGSFSLEVVDTKQIDSSIVHIIRVKKGICSVGDELIAVVDKGRREAIRRAHTATHLLQAALRKVLGLHVQQSGSLVEPDHLRFDFTHFRDLKDEELERVQDLMNDYVCSNDKVTVEILEKNKALKSGAIALFGEKYGQEVRVVSVGNYSKEFCGGTHLDYTGSIAVALIDSESSIGSGLRRIEACTGKCAYEKMKQDSDTVTNLSLMYKTARDNVVGETKSLLATNKKLEREIVALTQKNLESQIPDIIKRSKQSVNNVSYLIYEFKGFEMDVLRRASDLLMDTLAKSSVVFLASDKGVAIVRVTKDLKGKIDACALLTDIVKSFGGSGGGRPDFAQGGIKDGQSISKVIEKARQIIKVRLSNIA